MKRRSFLTMLGLAPLGAVAVANAGLRIPASSLSGDTMIEFKDGVLKLSAAYVEDISVATGPASAITKRVETLQLYPADLVSEINASTDTLLEGFQGVSG